jgi:hypothetical protein
MCYTVQSCVLLRCGGVGQAGRSLVLDFCSLSLSLSPLTSLLPYLPLDTQTVALQVLCDEEVRKGFSQSSFTEKLVPRACKEACLNKDANVKVRDPEHHLVSVFYSSIFSVL